MYSSATEGVQAAPTKPRPHPKALRKPGVKPRNILVVLTDDHRFDVMNFMKTQSFGETPTVHALREDPYRYVHHHVIRDIDELYDIENHPYETSNLLAIPGHETLAQRMSAKLFDLLEQTHGMQIPLAHNAGQRNALRNPAGQHEAPFPAILVQPPR